MKTLQEYKVIEEDTAAHISTEVSAALATGWTLVGGVQLGYCETDEHYYVKYAQALVREVPEPEKG